MTHPNTVVCLAIGLLSHTLNNIDQGNFNDTAGKFGNDLFYGMHTGCRTCSDTGYRPSSSLVSVLVNFYCDRLSETTCVPTILEGLVALTGFPHFSGANAVLVAKRSDGCTFTEQRDTGGLNKMYLFFRIIECVDLQRYPQTTRHSAYHVFQNLVDSNSQGNERIRGWEYTETHKLKRHYTFRTSSEIDQQRIRLWLL